MFRVNQKRITSLNSDVIIKKKSLNSDASFEGKFIDKTNAR